MKGSRHPICGVVLSAALGDLGGQKHIVTKSESTSENNDICLEESSQLTDRKWSLGTALRASIKVWEDVVTVVRLVLEG